MIMITIKLFLIYLRLFAFKAARLFKCCLMQHFRYLNLRLQIFSASNGVNLIGEGQICRHVVEF